MSNAVDNIIKEALTKQLNNKEHFIAQYLAATGADIRELVLCEQCVKSPDGLIYKYWIEEKGVSQRKWSNSPK